MKNSPHLNYFNLFLVLKRKEFLYHIMLTVPPALAGSSFLWVTRNRRRAQNHRFQRWEADGDDRSNKDMVTTAYMWQHVYVGKKILQAYGVPFVSYLGNYVRWIEYLLPENRGEKLGRKTPFSSHPTKAIRGKLGQVIFLLWFLVLKCKTGNNKNYLQDSLHTI